MRLIANLIPTACGWVVGSSLWTADLNLNRWQSWAIMISAVILYVWGVWKGHEMGKRDGYDEGYSAAANRVFNRERDQSKFAALGYPDDQ